MSTPIPISGPPCPFALPCSCFLGHQGNLASVFCISPAVSDINSPRTFSRLPGCLYPRPLLTIRGSSGGHLGVALLARGIDPLQGGQLCVSVVDWGLSRHTSWLFMTHITRSTLPWQKLNGTDSTGPTMLGCSPLIYTSRYSALHSAFLLPLEGKRSPSDSIYLLALAS